MSIKLISYTCFLSASLFLSSTSANAEDVKTNEKGQALRGDTLGKVTLYGFPDPYFRLLALEVGLKVVGAKVDWQKSYEKNAHPALNSDAFGDDESRIGFVIGVRLADAVIALMAKDAGKIRQCASDVKALGARIGISSEDLSSADTIVQSVQKEEWKMLPGEFGELRQDVLQRLDNGDDRRKGSFVAAGAWMQGLRYASDLILNNMGKVDLSNYLREGANPISELMEAEMKKSDPAVLEKPVVKDAIAALDKIKVLLNVKRDENVPQDKLQNVYDFATSSVNSALDIEMK